MILGNRTITPRAVYAGDRYVSIPPMGVVEIDDRYKTDVLAAIQPLLDAGALVVDSAPKPNERPVEVEGPKPPAELDAKPNDPRVNASTPKKTGEKVKI